MLVCQKSSAAQLPIVHAVPFEGSVESGAQKLRTKVAASCNDSEMTTSSQVPRGSLVGLCRFGSKPLEDWPK